MNILHIIGSGHLGGAETFVHQFVSVYQKKNPEHKSALFYIKKEGHLCTTTVVDQYDGTAYSSLSGMKQIFLIMQQYDLIIFHGLYPRFMSISFFTNCRIIYFMHGARSLRKSIKHVSSRMLKASYWPSKKSMQRFFRLLFFQFFLQSRCRYVLVPGNYYKQVTEKKYRVKSGKIKILSLGMDLNRFSTMDRKKTKVITGKINVGCVASFRKVKRIDRLIRAIGYLDEHEKANLTVRLVGSGEEENHLRHLTRQLGLEEQIKFIAASENLSTIYSQMDLFVLPSESESFSLVLLEAMYFSIPSIVFSGSGGAEELVNKTGCGMVVDNEKQLARVFSNLIKNPVLISTLNGKSRKIVEQNYTIEAVVENFLHLIKEEST
ncbi:glycosyltransferase [candidate division KSB1 bacterium]|nr:glycosyltransferase [candidate division KSB1 bacterium]